MDDSKINKILTRFLDEITSRWKAISIGSTRALIENSSKNNQELITALKEQDSSEIVKAIEDKELSIPEELNIKLNGIEAIAIKGEKGDQGDRGERGERGEKGDSGKDGKNGKDGKDGRDGLDGLNGIDGRDGLDGKDGQDGKDGSPDSPEQVRDKLETLDGDDRLDASAIKNLPEFVEKLPVGGVRFFENLADVSVQNKRADLIPQYDTTNNRWEDGIAITVSATQPTNPQINDLWVDIS